uniref:Interleukin 1 receptor type 1 n=1 Tax=Latimeria chalumnae TaxID=7897 RepID=H2ZW89_LATCH
IDRNSTHCRKLNMALSVYKKRDGMCIKNIFRTTAFSVSTAKVPCRLFMDIKKIDEHLQIKWYKECQLISLENKMISIEDQLLVQNTELNDSGNYTCEVIFKYNGTQYKASTTEYLNIAAVGERLELPKITFPQNEKLEFALGSKVHVPCTAFVGSSSECSSAFIYWLINDKFVEDYSASQINELEQDEHTCENSPTIKSQIIISEVLQEFYNLNFTCVVKNGIGEDHGCFQLKPPGEISSLSGMYAQGLIMFIHFQFTFYSVFYVFFFFAVSWYHGHKCSLGFITKRLILGKVYDAYVIYPQNNDSSSSTTIDNFVLEILPHVLETKCGYKLFIFGRDGVPGEATSHVVEETIKNSRRLIIILSSRFSWDSQAQTAFAEQIGLFDALIHNEIKVILIELEDIQDYTKFPESIRYIKEKQGTIKWKGDYKENSHSPNVRFWKQVKYQMPPR